MLKNLFSLFVVLFFVAPPSYAQFGLEGFSSGRYETKGSGYRPEESKVVTPLQDGETTKTLPRKTPAVGEGRSSSVGRGNPTKVGDKRSVASEPEYKELSKEQAAQYSVENSTGDNSKLTTAPVSPVSGKSASGKEESVTTDARVIPESRSQKKRGHNILNLDIRPGVNIVDSDSNYSYRNYSTQYSSVSVGGEVWFSKHWAVSGSMLTSLDADLQGLSNNEARVPARFEVTEISIKNKRYFGDLNPQELEFSILYSDSSLHISEGNLYRAKLNSKGFGLGVETSLYKNERSQWLIGAKIFPRLSHEESNTGVPIQSGDESKASRMEFSVGTQWDLDYGNSVIFRVNYALEKNLFDGEPAVADPATGLKPQGVGVDQSVLGLSLGYRWGR